MQQTWANLFFQHWEVDESMLQSHLPSGLTVDTFRGKAYLGICGLSMKSVRPQGLPALPWLSHFAELNVRTYVRDPEGNPGVYFFSLDCDRAIAVLAAQAFFSLPFRYARVSLGATDENFTLSCSRFGKRDTARYAWRPISNPKVSKPGTLEYHLLERYVFFTHRNGKLHKGRVHHPPYEVSRAESTEWSTLPLAWNGLIIKSRPPDLAHCCRGVSVAAYPLTPIGA